jgi:transposase
MAQDVCVLVNADDRARLVAIAGSGSRSYRHVVRARIILQSAERLPAQEVARRAGVSRPAVWRWQRRFAEQGVEGLLHDKPRVPGKAPLPTETVQQVLTLTCSEAPGEATHWTGRAMAAAVGIGFSSVRRIWRTHGLQPHRIRTFKRSKDPKFATKLRDISTSIRRPTRSCCRSTKRARSRRSIARSRACR